MTQTITAFDFEATGLDVLNEHILQIGLVKFDSNTFEEIGSRMWYIKPSYDYEIQPGAQEKTGITKQMIDELGVSLKSIWPEVVEFIGDDDMLSYNGTKYDIPLLYNNLAREGLSFDFKCRNFYDSLVIERKRNSMRLEDVYRRYTGEELEGAHDALNDVRGLIKIFGYQKGKTTEDIECSDAKLVSPEGFVRVNDEGNLIFATGKYRNETTNSICEKDPSYIKWVFEKFSPLTRESIRNAWFQYKENKK